VRILGTPTFAVKCKVWVDKGDTSAALSRIRI
jgi:hypothetical protein